MTHRPASLILFAWIQCKLPWRFCKFQSCLCKLHVESLLWYPSYQPWYPWPVFGLKQTSQVQSPPLETSCLKEAIGSPWHQSLILMKWRWSSFVSMVVNRRHPPCWRRRSALWACLPRRRLRWGRLVGWWWGWWGSTKIFDDNDICISIVS